MERARQELRCFFPNIPNVLNYYEVDRRCVENLFAAWEPPTPVRPRAKLQGNCRQLSCACGKALAARGSPAGQSASADFSCTTEARPDRFAETFRSNQINQIQEAQDDALE
jgi:hypothetical protein